MANAAPAGPAAVAATPAHGASAADPNHCMSVRQKAAALQQRIQEEQVRPGCSLFLLAAVSRLQYKAAQVVNVIKGMGMPKTTAALQQRIQEEQVRPGYESLFLRWFHFYGRSLLRLGTSFDACADLGHHDCVGVPRV